MCHNSAAESGRAGKLPGSHGPLGAHLLLESNGHAKRYNGILYVITEESTRCISNAERGVNRSEGLFRKRFKWIIFMRKFS